MRTSFLPSSLRPLGWILSLAALTLSVPQTLEAKAPSPRQTAEKETVRTNIDWPAFLAAKNMVWEKAPTSWDNAPFLGNGFIGMQLMRDAKEKNKLRLEVARMDAQEHLPMDPPDESTGNWSYKRYRLPIGYFTLELPDELKDWDLKLELWNAELTGDITTAKGQKLNLRAYAHATQPLLVVETVQENSDQHPDWIWHPYPNESPRMHGWGRNAGTKEAPKAVPGPAGSEVKADSGITAWKQPTRPSGLVSTAWQDRPSGSAGKTLHISINQSYPGDSSLDKAVSAVKKAASTPAADLTDTHRKWWHNYYPESFLSLPDAYWDAFYWAQIYKIGAGMRADGPVLDLQGPWTGLPVTSWPGVWWNLNVQLTYWPCYTGNRLDAARSLSNTLRKNRENLIKNVPEQYRHDSAGIPRASGHDGRQDTGVPGSGNGAQSEVGSLAWTCHNLFLQYKMTMDDAFLREDVVPLLRRAVNYYIHFLKKGEDGKLHLPPTLSPEYGTAPDANYDLALLRWGCETLLWSADRLQLHDPLLPKWKEILTDLADYPVNENGYMVGRGVPFSHTHRHYSHLFMVYPLHLVDTSLPENAELADKSIRHWHSLKGGLQGYSFSGGASLYATLLRGDDALDMLNGLKRYIRPNTLYRETWPVIETPLSGAASLHDMTLQSWNDVVHVFPAIPSAWKDLTFHNLRAQGAFLVSAQRKDGVTQWIRVKSLAGEPLRLRAAIADTARLTGSGAKSMKKDARGDWTGTPGKGSEILLALPDVTPVIAPVSTPPLDTPFGRP